MGIFDRIRSTVARSVFAPEYRNLTETTDKLLGIMDAAPIAFSSLDLSEVDDRTRNLIARHAADTMLFGMVGQSLSQDPANHLRVRMIEQSRAMYRIDPLTKRAVNVLTQFAFAKPIEISARDKTADEVWTAFEIGNGNERYMNPKRMEHMSRRLLVDGEQFFVLFISKIDGSVSMRRVCTEQIDEFITDPEDQDTVLFYKRRYTLPGSAEMHTVYYPDAEVKRYAPERLESVPLEDGAERADMMQPWTDVVMVPAIYEPLDKRGIPLMYAGGIWADVYKDFLKDRATLAKNVASVVDTITVKGGSRAVDLMRQRMQSSLAGSSDIVGEMNPAPVAGSIWVGNDAQRRQRMPLTTGAGDADIDGRSFLTQASMSAGLGPEWFGRNEPINFIPSVVQKVFESYRTLWAGIFEQLGGAVFWAAEEYGNKVINEKRLDISTDDLVKVDLRELSAAISLFTDRRLIPHKTAMLKVLQTLGIENAQEIVMEFGDKMEDEYKSIYHTQPSSSAPVIRDTDGEGGGKQVGGVGQQGDEDKETKLGIRPGSEKRITRRTM